MNSRGVFFSSDALIALVIIIVVLIVFYPIVNNVEKSLNIHYDSLILLSSLEIGDVSNSYVQGLISTGVINDTNKSALEQIGEFFVSDVDMARALADSIFSGLDLGNENLGIWYENVLIYSQNKSSMEESERVVSTRKIISGIQQGENLTGFSARSFLSSSLQTKYYYFGGYVGDGNITANITYYGNITEAELELAINNDFDLYVNGAWVSNYSGSPSDFTPSTYQIPINVYFNSGENIIEIKGSNLHIAGGFMKVTYESEVVYQQPERYKFPGIEGFVNLYDGFYIPVQPDTMEISLHLNSSVNTFLIIGNVTIFNGTTDDEETIFYDDSQLSSLLDYGSLAGKTTPLRLGLEGVNYIANVTGAIDVFSVTDLSGSMNQCVLNCSGGNPIKMIDLASDANKAFIDVLLNFTTSRVGLVGYGGEALESNYHPLSNDNESLHQGVNDWTLGTGTCICCGINRAIQGHVEESNPLVSSSMVVMSDGKANGKCTEQGTGSATDDAIQAACEAYQIYNITVHSVGFGSGADEETLQAIAACGNGNYYFSTIEELIQRYEEIAQDILERIYVEQTLVVIGNLFTKLYADSYIEFNYIQPAQQFGLILSLEEQFDDAYSGTFSVPLNATLIDVTAISYSGQRWTDNVSINNQSVYDLPGYGNEYITIGDPYAISIPVSAVNLSGENVVRLTTGLLPMNSSEGSVFNKILYTISKSFSAFSPIASSSAGCIWTVQFEDYSNITVSVPSTYTGSNLCSYSEGSQSYNINDAFQASVYNLLETLDLDGDGKVDIVFTEQDLQVSVDEVTGIPFTWSTEVQARTWY